MADQSLLGIKVTDFTSIREFFGELGKREHLHVVRVADWGLVEPARRANGAIVMQPMVRVVATAFDHGHNEILRWHDKWDVGSSVVTVNAGAGAGGMSHGRHADPTGARTRDAIIAECRKRGLQVERDREWTREEIVVDTLAGIDREPGK